MILVEQISPDGMGSLLSSHGSDQLEGKGELFVVVSQGHPDGIVFSRLLSSSPS